jgi:hypothetical protein
MDEELRFRAALVDSFVHRLRRLTATQLDEIASAHRLDDQFYGLALDLAGEATRLVGRERASDFEVTMRDRLGEVERILPREPQADARGACDLAKGAVQALLARDIASFNAGAFAKLYGPFSAHIMLADVENDARQALRGEPPR